MRPLSFRAVAALASLALANCGARVVDRASVSGPLPAHLSETGLYEDAARDLVRADVLPYSPQYPLWSDGARKRRWIHLPEGRSIDATDPDHWVFPIGTRLWKEFAFEQRVETRYAERRADGGWTYAAYVWNAEQTDAELAPERGIANACRSADGTPYDVPARADCLLCHAGGQGPVLGFGALQLSTDRDPLAPHAEEPPPGAVDLKQLVERGLVRHLPRRFAEDPPRIAAASPRERAALGYLHANCGACHSESGPLAHLDLALAHSLGAAKGADALRSTLGRPSTFVPPAFAAAPAWRIAGGDPERSVLVARMSTRDPNAQMPPLGSHAIDRDALDLLRAWVREDLGTPER